MRTRQAPRIVLCLILVCGMGLVALASTLREPISIRSEADLQTSKGVLYGSGSEKDPYVISGWKINVQSGIGIEVKDVSAYVVVRGCTVVGNGRSGTGILLRGAPHVQVVDCQLADLAAGIFLYQNAQGSVNGNTISSCRRGIAGTESDSVVIIGNQIEQSAERGLFLWRCHDAIMADNVLFECTDGIYLDSCHRDMLTRNRVEGSVHGVFLWDSFDCQATENIVRGCELGFAIVHTSEDNRVFGNTFGENDRAATCDNPQNLWDAGYPEGGNFWRGESFSDLLSGESQDRNGSDGIADQPREIPFGSLDRYPLMQEPAAGDSS